MALPTLLPLSPPFSHVPEELHQGGALEPWLTDLQGLGLNLDFADPWADPWSSQRSTQGIQVMNVTSEHGTQLTSEL